MKNHDSFIHIGGRAYYSWDSKNPADWCATSYKVGMEPKATHTGDWVRVGIDDEMQNIKPLQAGPEIEVRAAKKHPSTAAIVTCADGKNRQVVFYGSAFHTVIWKNGRSYGARNTTLVLNPKTFGAELGEKLKAAYFEHFAEQWKATMEQAAVDLAARGTGVVYRPELLDEVNAYLASK